MFGHARNMMTEKISVIIPAHNEEVCLPRCLESVRAAERKVPATVEVVVVLNRCTDGTESIARDYGAKVIAEPARNLARIRNTGIRSSQGDIIVTIDADSWMSANMLHEVSRRLATGKYIGGGVRIMPERMSLGIVLSTMTFAPRLLLERTWAGAFWMRRQAFDAIHGFNEELVSAEDVDFAKRLRAYGRSLGLRYGAIMRAHIVTSCRKFDHFGDWYLLKNRRLVSRILSGRDQEAANHFYYDLREGRECEPNHVQEDTARKLADPQH
jgi:glycosyltransferase involved in cell wall biosynthesis